MILASFMFKTGFSSSIYRGKIHFFKVFIGFIRKNIMYMMVRFGVNRLYIRKFVYGWTERTVGQLNFRKYEFLLFLIFSLSFLLL